MVEGHKIKRIRAMRLRCAHLSVLAVGLMALCVAGASGEVPQPTTGSDPLVGRWWIHEGREVGGEGFYCDPTTRPACGTADFRSLLAQRPVVNFAPERLPRRKGIPWGSFEYRFSSNGILALTTPGGLDTVRCFLKFQEDRMRSLGTEPARPLPHILVFYSPEGRQAFRLVRKGVDIGPKTFSSTPSSRYTVFVPYEDVLTGSWIVLPSRPTAQGHLECRLNATAPLGAARLQVRVDNIVELSEGATKARFRLRQTDPTHWDILGVPGGPVIQGRLILERSAGEIVGSNFLITRWRIGTKMLTAVLRAEGSRGESSVPVLQFPGAQPLSAGALLRP